MTSLDELLGKYFDAAYAEGLAGRSHDTPEGTAQQSLNDIHEFFKAQIAAETEACAKLMEGHKAADLRLIGGELTAQEVRTVQAFLTNRAAVIRRRIVS